MSHNALKISVLEHVLLKFRLGNTLDALNIKIKESPQEKSIQNTETVSIFQLRNVIKGLCLIVYIILLWIKAIMID